MHRNQDRDPNRVIEATRETVTGSDVIHHPSQNRSLARDQSLRQNLGQGREVNLAVNDREVTKIRCQHCQGRFRGLFFFFSNGKITNLSLAGITVDVENRRVLN